ncbi:sucrose-6F-phosphate phosphohydrolase [Desulfosporosinus acididurans]|uniref:Sucrose-6F-phosphate phosphohydrolase n=1 Tax=Desulfosporosinus acididurans TaxID=476652 RepID=A0A0J1FTP7_9FIRM|nr:HAD family hydrolase [Desulfosporosinus acididurans]KLU66839.1 sucrose-6F-phosphate phosphohydrolase [Desulfosporosinus acididurans]
MTKSVLFASDLDQTLIYSRRSIIPSLQADTFLSVEQLDNQDISYMSPSALKLLKEISRQILFVPVTTRTKLQYSRVNFQGYGIYPRYAVTSNGGTIIKEGREDKGWEKQVLAGWDYCAEARDLLRRFREISHPSWVLKDSDKLADDLFYYCIVDRSKIPFPELEEFTLWAGKMHWNLSLQGRKLYLIPRHVSKKSAIQYLQEKEGLSTLVAAGDSLLDLELLQKADAAYAPSHGELYLQSQTGGVATKRIDTKGIQFTTTSGISAAEEILQNVVQRILV